MMPTKSDVPTGMVHVRTVVSKGAARNHTLPDCPDATSNSAVSTNGCPSSSVTRRDTDSVGAQERLPVARLGQAPLPPLHRPLRVGVAHRVGLRRKHVRP